MKLKPRERWDNTPRWLKALSGAVMLVAGTLVGALQRRRRKAQNKK